MKPDSIISVEERLRSSLVLCRTLRHLALLADEHRVLKVRRFCPRRILRTVPATMRELEAQLNAVQAALPSECANQIADPVKRRRRS
jgi:hypothetical protein